MTLFTVLTFGCGAGLGVGCWLLLAASPRFGHPRLDRRIAPYLIDVSEEARVLLAQRRSGPFATRMTALTRSRPFRGSDTIAVRLHQAGADISVEQFRVQQLGYGAVGMLLGAAALALPAVWTLPSGIRFILPLLGAVCAATLRSMLLTLAAKHRVRRITDELPTVLEFLTLSLAAGESIFDAIHRVARGGSGELAHEFATVVAAVGSGIPFAEALSQMSAGLRIPALSRCVDQIIGSTERGTPVARVLAAQAGDVRAEAKRVLLETAGRKEIAMLIPLVFLILPLTVVFAAFPGVFVLQMGF